MRLTGLPIIMMFSLARGKGMGQGHNYDKGVGQGHGSRAWDKGLKQVRGAG